MSSTQEWRKCYICGEPVLWQTNGIGWHPIQYHDCKPVPGARLEKVERERDEARAALAVERQHRDGHLPSCAGIDREEGRCGCGYLDGTAYRDMTERMEQATALLREARPYISDPFMHYESMPCKARDVAKRIDAFTAGQPAPVKPVVDDAMVEIMCVRIHGFAWSLNLHTDDAQKVRDGMRAALVAALEGRA